MLTVKPDHVQELPDKDLFTLLVRLPFRVPDLYNYNRKLVRAIRSQRVQTKTLVLLHRTAEIEPWFANAHEQDIARRTQLGTLGYLPIEVRLQIWAQFVTPEGPMAPWGDFVTTIESVGPRFFDNKEYRTHDIWDDIYSSPGRHLIPLKIGGGSCPFVRRNCAYRMNEVSHDLAAEVQQTFFFRHTIAFEDPMSFTAFLQMIPPDPEQSFAFYLKIYEEKMDAAGGFPAAWYDALERIPKNTRSVTFELGRWTASVEGQLQCLDVLNKRVKRSAPGAIRRIAPCSEGADVEGRWRMWEEVLRDVEG